MWRGITVYFARSFLKAIEHLRSIDEDPKNQRRLPERFPSLTRRGCRDSDWLVVASSLPIEWHFKMAR